MANGSTRGAVLLTGASTGIGRACVEHLDGLGFTVFAGVRTQSDADSLREGGSARTRPLLLDVTDAESIRVAADTVEETFPAGLSGLVNNAGIAVGGPVEFVALEEWRRVLEVNFVGQIAVTQATLPALRRARGRIVNVTSIGGRLATPFFGPYNASKFALEAVTEALRLELRRFGVQVSAVEPGAVATPIWDKGRAASEQLLGSMGADGLEPLRSRDRGAAQGHRQRRERGRAADRGGKGGRARTDREPPEGPLRRGARREDPARPLACAAKPHDGQTHRAQDGALTPARPRDGAER